MTLVHFSTDQSGEAANCSCVRASIRASRSSLSAFMKSLYDVTPGRHLWVQQVHWRQWHAE